MSAAAKKFGQRQTAMCEWAGGVNGYGQELHRIAQHHQAYGEARLNAVMSRCFHERAACSGRGLETAQQLQQRVQRQPHLHELPRRGCGRVCGW